MSGSVDAVGEASAAFADRFGDAHLRWLALAFLIQLLSLLVRGRVWCSILRVAFPSRIVPAGPAIRAYLIGVGANAVAPARGGDIARLCAVRRVLPGALVATLVSTLVAETAFGFVVVVALASFAVAAGWLPPLVSVPDGRAGEQWLGAHTVVAVAGLLVVVVVAFALTRSCVRSKRVKELGRQLAQGLQIMRTPSLFVTRVAVPQLGDWVLRGGVAYAMLSAFSIHPSLKAAVLVLVIDSAATALPFTPSGVGTQQGLLVLALGGASSSAQILAYSVGAQLAVTLANVLIGVVALYLSFGSLRFRSVTPSIAAAP